MKVSFETINYNLKTLINDIENPKQKRILERALAEINIENKRVSQPQRVLNAIASGAFTYSDISAETGIPYPSLPRILSKLIAQKKVIQQTFKPFKSRSKWIFRLP